MKGFLEIKDLSLTLGDFRLGPISFSLSGNDYLMLLGPSGCGKTSILRAIGGIYEVPPGILWIDGKDIGALPSHKRKVGYVDQHIDLFPHIDVAHNVAFGLKYVSAAPAEKRAAFDRIIKLLGLTDLTHRRPATLSGGESRRVTLARSLVVAPRILLLDEPLSMLDHNAREEMLDVLISIHRELGTATIHVTHDRYEAWRIGGTCAVMHAGAIEQFGAVEDLFRKPVRSVVARFLGSPNIFPAIFKRNGGSSRADVGWAEFELSIPVAFNSGFIFIRPETLVPVDQSGLNTIETKVLSRIDRGIYSELRVEARADGILFVHLTGHEHIKPGMRVFFECRVPPHPMEE